MNLNPRALRTWIGLRGLNQKALAQGLIEAGLAASRSTVYAWLRGTACPRDAAVAIARRLKCRVEDLTREPVGVLYEKE